MSHNENTPERSARRHSPALIAIVAALGPGLRNSLLAVSLVWWPFYARVVRGEVRALAGRPHVEAARMAGAGPVRIALVHLLPGVIPTAVITATMDLGTLVLTLDPSRVSFGAEDGISGRSGSSVAEREFRQFIAGLTEGGIEDQLLGQRMAVQHDGEGIASGKHASRFSGQGTPGVLHGAYTYVIQDDEGQTVETHSVSAGLDYPGVGPEHAFLKDSGRAEYVCVTDDEALAAFHRLTRTEGILPALESSHAVAQAIKLARELPKDQLVLCNLSGRGDKDINTVAKLKGIEL